MALSQLIVNADDFGISPMVNRAVLSGLENGLVTSTSIMANMPGFEDAVALTRQHGQLAGKIGLHINLTEGYPLTASIRDCPVFCGHGGYFIYDRRPLFYLGGRTRAAIYEEMRAQLEKVLAAGISPIHLDSHHHVHTEWAIAPLVCRLGREYAIPRIRLTRNMGEIRDIPRRIYKKIFNSWRLGRRKDFSNTDYFGDMEDMKHFTGTRRATGKSIEVMVHLQLNDNGKLVVQ
jgi:chitin disaccharide deacetylase